jgi:hypothetical protein
MERKQRGKKEMNKEQCECAPCQKTQHVGWVKPDPDARQWIKTPLVDYYGNPMNETEGFDITNGEGDPSCDVLVEHNHLSQEEIDPYPSPNLGPASEREYFEGMGYFTCTDCSEDIYPRHRQFEEAYCLACLIKRLAAAEIENRRLKKEVAVK